MNKALSIKHQKIAGTYNRNLDVKKKVDAGWSFAAIGRFYGISRERPRQILRLPSENHHPKKKRWWKWW